MNPRLYLETKHLNKFNKINKDFQIYVENNNCIYAIVNWFENIQIKINKLTLPNEYPLKSPDIKNLEVILNNKLDGNKEIIKLKSLDNILNYFENETEYTESFCAYKNYNYSWSPVYRLNHFFLQFSNDLNIMIKKKIENKKKFIKDILDNKTNLQFDHIVTLINNYLSNDYFILKE